MDIYSLLPTLLATVERAGEYCTTGTAELPVMRASVDGLGLLGLPIVEAQAKALASLASPAPYGRGADTVYDPDVRRCGQIAASAVHLDDPRWVGTIELIVAEAAVGLGVDGVVHGELYKLLIYGPGDFFAEHRDTEKASRMFGTLVVALPSEHRGGALVVRHGGREAALPLDGEDLGVARWAAFYADCQHELRPVEAGWRVVLVYNLVLAGGARPPVPDERPTITKVVAALRGADEDVAKVVYPLAHKYTLAELSFAMLKREDAAVAGVLRAAADEAGWVLRLALVSITESGAAEPTGWDEDEEYDDEDFEVLEVYDRDQTLGAWRGVDDQPEELGDLPFDDEDVSPPGALDNEEADEQSFHEASGNEGSSFERTYRRAALVLWDEETEFSMLNEAGPAAGVAALKRFLDRGDTTGAERMAAVVVEEWMLPDPTRPATSGGDTRTGVLRELQRLPTTAALARFLRRVTVAGGLKDEDVEAVAAALGALPDTEAGEIVEALVETCGHWRLAPVASLLLHLAKTRPGPWLADAFSSLSTATEKATFVDPKLPSVTLGRLLEAVAAFGNRAVVEGMNEAVLGTPTRWQMGTTVVPALIAAPAGLTRTVGDPLRRAAIAWLEGRIAEPLAPPPDATRSAAGLGCRCASCGSLRVFLLDPVQRVWRLKAVQHARSHVEEQLQRANLDCSLATERKGSPHALVVTKTQATYEKRVLQRTQDRAALAALR